MIDFLNSDREKRTKSIRISMLFALFLLAAFAIKGKMWIYLNFFLCPFYDFVDVKWQASVLELEARNADPVVFLYFIKDRVCVAECEETFQISDIVGKFHIQILDPLCRRRGSRVKHCKYVCLKMRIWECAYNKNGYKLRRQSFCAEAQDGCLLIIQ